MKTKKVLIALLAVFVVLSIAVSVICFKQYGELQRQKIYSITNAFMLMQKELDVAAENDYKSWYPSGTLELLDGQIPVEGYDSMGDYQKIHDVIHKVIRTDGRNTEEIAYFDQVRQMRISTSTETWKWAAYLKQGD